MFQFIEKRMRGGVSYISNRYGKASNKYMKEYDEKASSKYIMYLDVNSLYGWATLLFEGKRFQDSVVAKEFLCSTS